TLLTHLLHVSYGQALTDLYGDWQYRGLDIPNDLTDITANITNETESGFVTFSAVENFSGQVPVGQAIAGNMILASPNVLNLQATGETLRVEFFFNAAADTLVGVPRGENNDNLPTVLLKEPTTGTVSGVYSSSWNLIEFRTATTLEVLNGFITDFDGGDSEYFLGSLDINGSGGLTLTINDPEGAINLSGSVTAGASPGVLTITLNGLPGSLSPAINEARDVMAMLSPEDIGLFIFVREPSSLSLADMAGFWYFASVEVPTDFNDNGAGQEFGRQFGLVQLASDGSFSGTVDGGGVESGGAFSIGSNPGEVLITAPGEDPLTVFVNESKNFFVGIEEDNDSIELVMGVKGGSDVSFGNFLSNRFNLTISEDNGTVTVNWAETAGRTLQEFGPSDTQWSDVSTSGGEYTVNLPDDESVMLRVKED
ncbi:MAG: hypothetical protein AAGA45_06860, partial [Verrucomicrobiota bacterium]